MIIIDFRYSYHYTRHFNIKFRADISPESDIRQSFPNIRCTPNYYLIRLIVLQIFKYYMLHTRVRHFIYFYTPLSATTYYS